jgi:hypothetical protein
MHLFPPPWALFRSGGPHLQASVNLSPLDRISECWYRIVGTASRTPTKSMTNSVSKGLSATMKALRHSVEGKVNGDDDIEVFPFLRLFKEAADNLNVSEGAATRILPSFLDGMAREGHRAHLDDAPMGARCTRLYAVPIGNVCCRRSPHRGLHGSQGGSPVGRRNRKGFWAPPFQVGYKGGKCHTQRRSTGNLIEGLPPFVRSGCV